MKSFNIVLYEIFILLIILITSSCTVPKNISKNDTLTKEKVLLYLEPGRVYRILDLNDNPKKIKINTITSEIIKGMSKSLPFEMSLDDFLLHNQEIYRIDYSSEKTTILKHIIIISAVLAIILIFGYSYCAGCIM